MAYKSNRLTMNLLRQGKLQAFFSYPQLGMMNKYTFHAKYEGALHLMLMKMYLLFIFRLITTPLCYSMSIILSYGGLC